MRETRSFVNAVKSLYPRTAVLHESPLLFFSDCIMTYLHVSLLVVLTLVAMVGLGIRNKEYFTEMTDAITRFE